MKLNGERRIKPSLSRAQCNSDAQGVDAFEILIAGDTFASERKFFFTHEDFSTICTKSGGGVNISP